MKCRCGHSRMWHRRASGIKRLPCQFRLRGGPRFPSGAPSGAIVKCKCRDWHPEEVNR